MRILYCYAKFYDRLGNPKKLRGLDNIELNFSTTDIYRYDELNNTLKRSPRKTPLPENFWASGTPITNIYNITPWYSGTRSSPRSVKTTPTF